MLKLPVMNLIGGPRDCLTLEVSLMSRVSCSRLFQNLVIIRSLLSEDYKFGMKLLLLLLLLLLPAAACAAIDYKLDIDLYPEEQLLIATAEIDLGGRIESLLKLRLNQRCEILAVRQGERTLPYDFSAGVLQLEPDSTKPLSISYRAVFNDQLAETPLHNEEPGYGISASIGAAGSYLSSAANWYPQLAGEEANYRISISAPLGTEALTSGRRLTRQVANGRSNSVWLVDYPLQALTLSAGPYQIFEDLTGPVPIYAYFYADSAPLAASYLEEARDYLKLYTELFGPYPFHKFAIVENFFPTGYGLPSWTLLGSSVIKLPFIVKTSLGHEIAHSWWGIGVQVDYAQGNWAEGLTTYVADYLYQERSSKEEAREYRQNILRDYANLVGTGNVMAINRFSSRHDKASQAIGYGKTALLFHMLRQQIGDKAFWAGLRQLAQARMHTLVGWDDFSALFSEISGQDLQPFFEQWLTRKDGPQLALQDVQLVQTENGENGKQRWRVSGRMTQQPVYQLAVELQLSTETEILRQRVQLDTESQTFSFTTTSRPLLLQADPDADLFRILAQEELPATVNSIRGSNHLLVLRAEQHVPDDQAIRTLLGALRKAELPVRSLNEVDQAELASHDLLIFGLANQLRPAQLQATDAGRFTLARESVNPNEQSSFIVEPNPLNSGRKAAWFVSDDRLATVVARKIPHYGKYSYLMFNGVENRLKGIRTPVESTLRIYL